MLDSCLFVFYFADEKHLLEGDLYMSLVTKGEVESHGKTSNSVKIYDPIKNKLKFH